MGKTILTQKIEKALYKYLYKNGKYACLEVTAGIGWSEDGRVDMMATDTKSNIYCYEIKVTKNDFLSNAKKTFIGNYNYFVIPDTLLDEIFPYYENYKNVGLILYNEKKDVLSFYKNVRKQKISEQDTNKYLLSMVRSCVRDVTKLYHLEDDNEQKKLQEEFKNQEKELKNVSKNYKTLTDTLIMLLGGVYWQEELESMKHLYKMSDGTLKFLICPTNNYKTIKENTNIEIYKFAQKCIKKYLQNCNISTNVFSWFDICLSYLSKQELCEVLKSISYEIDSNGNYILDEKDRNKIHSYCYEDFKLNNNKPYLTLKEKQQNQNLVINMLLKQLQEEKEIQPFVIKSIDKNISFCLKTKDETHYLTLKKGTKNPSIDTINLLLLSLKIDEKGIETYELIENVLTINNSKIDDLRVLEILKAKELFPISNEEFDKNLSNYLLKNEIPINNIENYL